MSQTTDRGRCLSFTVHGEWAHFRRIEGNNVKQTYRVMPRTTISGMLAAMLGVGRDQYYDWFTRDRSDIAVSLAKPITTMQVPRTVIETKSVGMEATSARTKGPQMEAPVYTDEPQIHNYEYLTDAAYRIDVAFDGEPYNRLKDHLESGTAHYTPSLGRSECLALIDYHGEYEVNTAPAAEVGDGATASVDSVVPDNEMNVIPASGNDRIITERSPATMDVYDGGRRTTGFITHSLNPTGNPIDVRGMDVSAVDGRTVVFS